MNATLVLNKLYENSGCQSHGEFAAKVGMDRTVVSRLLTGSRLPNQNHLRIFSAFAGIDLNDIITGKVHINTIENNLKSSMDLPVTFFRTIRNYTIDNQTILEKYIGQYNMYYTGFDKSTYICSFLEIKRSKFNELDVHILNPYRHDDGTEGMFRYQGYLFPTESYLYGFAEQQDHRYELINLILYAVQNEKVTSIRGMFSGIGVKNNVRSIAATEIFLLRLNRWLDVKDLPKETVGFR